MRTVLKGAVCGLFWFLLVFSMTGCGGSKIAMYSPFDDVNGRPCQQVRQAGRQLVRNYYSNESIDSARAALTYWTDQCGSPPDVDRVRLLLDIKDGTFNQFSYDRDIIDNILEFQGNPDWPGGYYWFLRYVEYDETMTEFARRIAQDALPETPDSSEERLLCECFAGDCDELFQEVSQPAYSHTRLAKYRRDEIHRILDEREEANFAFYTGLWSPMKNNSLGNHPVLGIVMGGNSQGFAFNISSEVRLLNAKDDFIIARGNVNDTTNQLVGYFVGADIGKDIYRDLRRELLVRVGFGFDGFEYTNRLDEKFKVHAVNANVGLTYKMFLHEYSLSYIGVEAVYNVMNYERHGNQNFGNDAVSLRLLVGWSGNSYSMKRLKALAYNGRE
ncbi:MAG: hypothetical protein R3F48_16940 [Candidatus Zixiibacteriota bacterium]